MKLDNINLSVEETKEIVKKDKELSLKINKYIDDCVKHEKVPTNQGFCLTIGQSYTELKKFVIDGLYINLNLAMERLELAQHEILLENGLKNAKKGFNSTITKLLLESNHGYTERTHTTQDINLGVVMLPPRNETPSDDTNHRININDKE